MPADERPEERRKAGCDDRGELLVIKAKAITK